MQGTEERSSADRANGLLAALVSRAPSWVGPELTLEISDTGRTVEIKFGCQCRSTVWEHVFIGNETDGHKIAEKIAAQIQARHGAHNHTHEAPEPVCGYAVDGGAAEGEAAEQGSTEGTGSSADRVVKRNAEGRPGQSVKRAKHGQFDCPVPDCSYSGEHGQALLTHIGKVHKTKAQPPGIPVRIIPRPLDQAKAKVRRQNEVLHAVFAQWRAKNATDSLLDDVAAQFSAGHSNLMAIARDHYGELFGAESLAHLQCCDMLDALGAAYEGTDTSRHRDERAKKMFEPVTVRMRNLSHSVLEEVEIGGESFEREVNT